MFSIGENIKNLRKEKHVTQAEVGKAVGVSTQAVSKWECGGVPDIEMLPLIADYFGISIDELFGRSVDEKERLEQLIYAQMLQTSENMQMEKACLYCWAMFKAMLGIDSFAGDKYSKSAPLDEVGALARLSFDRGHVFMNATEDFHYFSIFSEPEAGYSEILATLNEYSSLFTLLSNPDRLKILTYVYSSKQSLVSVEIAARETQISCEHVATILNELCDLGWVLPESIDMGEGVVRVYRADDNDALLPLLNFAREFIVNTKLFYMKYPRRRKPLLSDMLK